MLKFHQHGRRDVTFNDVTCDDGACSDANLGIFTSSGGRELAERRELFLKIDINIDNTIVLAVLGVVNVLN